MNCFVYRKNRSDNFLDMKQIEYMNKQKRKQKQSVDTLPQGFKYETKSDCFC